ncbi:Sodium/hydrogen exchanger [Amylocystis lapponica]|nr:Sodium/hydrogen exchanger [Amylocystis lapponica]
MSHSAYPYTQPPLQQLLVVSSFLYLLNVVRALADYALNAGLIAELLLGTVYGTPLGGILLEQWEATFNVLGYLGLLCIVFEGGLSTNLPVLLSNLSLSCVCALTGVAVPIVLSLALLSSCFGYSLLEAFAAGAALCSTSLGTTLAALGSHTRIGTVLISAAIIDDVVGLVIAALIPALAALDRGAASSRSPNLAWTAARPVLSSVLIAILTPLVARFFLRKPWGWLRTDDITAKWGTEAHADAVKLAVMMLGLSAFSTPTYYTGSSVLFGAYVAGLTLSYLIHLPSVATECTPEIPPFAQAKELSFEDTYARTIAPVQQYVLGPLFFASIGYAIPSLSLWRPSVIWRGIVYALLMCMAKLAVGIPLIIYSVLLPTLSPRGILLRVRSLICVDTSRTFDSSNTLPSPRQCLRTRLAESLPAAAFLGIAMVARGEIGLLVAQIGHSSGLLDDDVFLLCVWAILLCTLAGPVGVGALMRRYGGSVVSGKWA